jgi:hypothetical protein
MLGQTLVGLRLRDLRSVLMHLASDLEFESRPFVLWGDSFAPTNPHDRDPATPYAVEPFPDTCEPMGGLLALFGGLFEDVKAVYAHGCLVSFGSLLQGPFLYAPHDVIVPGMLTAGDVCDVGAALAPRPLRMEGLVDGLNRRVPHSTALEVLQAVHASYEDAGAAGRLVLDSGTGPGPEAARWLLGQLPEA